MPYGSYSAGAYMHNPYMYSQLYGPSSYYYGAGAGYGGYYPPYGGYYGRYRSPGLFRGLLNRLRYGSYYGNPYSPIMYDSHGHRMYPGETNYVSSVKDLWKSNDVY